MSDTYYPPSTNLRFVIIPVEEERRLFKGARAGDEVAKEFLIRNHLLFAAMFARRLSKGRLPDAEVVSAANTALMTAFNRFDATHESGSRFASYLRPFIKGEISQLWKEHFRAVTPLPQEAVPERGADPHEEQSDNEHLHQLKLMLSECSGELTERERLIVHQHYFVSRTFADIGRECKVSREAIRIAHGRAITKLQQAFRSRGVINSQ